MRIVIHTILYSLIGLSSLVAQNPNEIRATNNYISFVNESIHGLLIAHRLFENYNQTINKYVDLPEYQLNNYSNADLPDNIFIDEEKWFYETSPYSWHETAQRESHFLGPNAATINQHVNELKKILGVINNKRISIATLLENSDLTQSANLQKVYGELEEVVSHYDRFYEIFRALDSHFLSTFPIEERRDKYSRAFRAFYNRAKDQMHKVRLGESLNQDQISIVNTDLIKLEKTTSEQIDQNIQKRILTNASRLTRAFRDYINDKDIPIEKRLYGPSYHYYNVGFLNQTNKYGNGFVREYNDAATQKGYIMETEMPQLYKVIYPKKLPKEELTSLDDNELDIILAKETPTIKPSAPDLTNIPTTTTIVQTAPEETTEQEAEPEAEPEVDYSRGVVVHHEKIYASADSFDLELYDHLIKDGDRVSIMVNDQWMFKNISLEKEPRVVTIHIRPGQQNFILIHADNTGYRPPNTIAMAYMVDGERKEISLTTDLENSQMVEIQYGN